MKKLLSRRALLGAAAGLSLASLVSCASESEAPNAFPQGIASGDPRPDGIVLWTRVEPSSPDAPETVAWVVATDRELTHVVAEGTFEAKPDADHTVRVRVAGLSPRTTYFYRFHARGVGSVVGRTKTAPAPDDDVPARIAVASCQDFVGRHYHAWRWLAEHGDDEDTVDLVLFLGDYIYEYTTGTDVTFAEDAGDRGVEIPDGFTVTVDGNDTTAARTLRDYRALYKRYKTDAFLQRVHALYPFAIIWDDHEFANDCWQDHATDFNGARGDEKDPERRQAATQAWFEYLPLDLKDKDSPIYRSLRWGKHLEIALTDDRSYRSDHVIPEGPVDASVGKMLPNSPLGSRLMAKKAAFDERERAVNPTMLGQTQKQWLVDTIKNSPATWKVWASGTVVAPMVLDLRSYDHVPESMRDIVYFKLDQWDGYRSERQRILQELDGVRNLVVLSGDIHAFYGSHLHVDFDEPGPKPIGVELTTAGITSSSVQEQVRSLVENSPLLRALGLATVVDQFDPNMRGASPHFTYTNSNTQGIMMVEIDGDREMRASMIQFDDVRSPEYRGESRVERFSVASGSSNLVRAMIG